MSPEPTVPPSYAEAYVFPGDRPASKQTEENDVRPKREHLQETPSHLFVFCLLRLLNALTSRQEAIWRPPIRDYIHLFSGGKSKAKTQISHISYIISGISPGICIPLSPHLQTHQNECSNDSRV